MRFVTIAAALGFALTASAQFGPRQRTRDTPPVASVEAPACVSVRAEGRPDGVGFSHFVIVENRCALSVVCDVGTDADPSPVHLVVAPGTTEEAVVRRASPAPGVAARGRCVESRR